ncbi:MAG: cytochrome c biogenesis protein ResB, partial [Cyanobacteriota bacterium]
MKKIITFLKSTYFLLTILIIIILALIAGSLFPLEEAIKLIFDSLLFKIISFCLLLSLISCIISSLKHLTTKPIFFIIHAGLIIIISGGIISYLCLNKGIMQLYVGENSCQALNENNEILELPFEIKLKSFEVEKYPHKQTISLKFLDTNFKELNTYTVNEGNKFPIPLSTESLKITKISKEDHSITNVLVNINGFERWVGTNNTAYIVDEENGIYMIFLIEDNNNIKGFKSLVEIIKDNKVVNELTLEVNKPLLIDGYKIYQYSYDRENMSWSGLMVKKDPGAGVV